MVSEHLVKLASIVKGLELLEIDVIRAVVENTGTGKYLARVQALERTVPEDIKESASIEPDYAKGYDKHSIAVDGVEVFWLVSKDKA